MKESNVQNTIRLEAAKDGVVLWRNNRGKVQDKEGRWHVFGVGPNGASDLIGFKTIEITSDMIGQRIAVFVAVEVKSARGSVKSEQVEFIDKIISRGGLGCIARCYNDVKKILTK